MASGQVLPYLDVPLQHSHPDVLQAHEAAGQRREEPGAHRALARGVPGARDPQHLHRRLSRRDGRRVRAPARLHARGGDRPRRLLCLQPGAGRRCQRHSRACCREAEREARRARFMEVAEAVSIAKLRERIGATMQVLVDSAPGAGPQGRRGPHLCRRARDRRHRAAAAAREDQQDAEGRRVHPGPHRRRRGARPDRACRSDAAAIQTAKKKATGDRWLESSEPWQGLSKLGAQKRTRTSTMLLAST